MKQHFTRLEITAFRRRVTIVADASPSHDSGTQPPSTEVDAWRSDTDSTERVDIQSDSGQLIVIEAIHCLQQSLLSEVTGEVLRKDEKRSKAGLRRYYGTRKLRLLCELVWRIVRVRRKEN